MEATAKGPLKTGGADTFLTSYCLSFIGLIGRIAGGQNSYQDLSFKLQLPTAGAGTFSLWGIGGKSFTITPYRKYQFQKQQGVVASLRYRNYENDFQDKDIDYDMSATGLMYTLPLGSKVVLSSTVAASTQGYDNRTQWLTAVSDTINDGTLYPYSTPYTRNTRLTSTTKLKGRLGRRLSITTGFTYDYLRYTTQTRQVV